MIIVAMSWFVVTVAPMRAIDAMQRTTYISFQKPCRAHCWMIVVICDLGLSVGKLFNFLAVFLTTNMKMESELHQVATPLD